MKFTTVLVSLFVLLSIVGVFLANGDESPMVRMEFDRPLGIPAGWTLVRQAVISEDKKHSFLIALKIQNKDKLEHLATSVSDPASSQYGKYLTLEQVADLIRPEKEVVQEVVEWLSKHVAASDIEVLPRGDWIRFHATIPQAEELLNCKFHIFQQRNTKLIRTLEYFAPKSIAKLVDFISGTVRFPKIKKAPRSQVTLVDSPQALVTPQVIKNHYNVTDVGKSSQNLQSVNQFLEQYYSPSDLAAFFNRFSLPDNTVTKVVGPNKPGDPGVEASLDIEYIMGVATDVPTWFIYTAGNDNGNQEPFIEWITALIATQNAPWVNSVSYGDVEASISGSYLERTDIEFQTFALTGRSVLFASGDSGTGCKRCSVFTPDWPASSPWVTTVGGTQMDQGTEVAVGFSGGGFSNYFARPSYQNDSVMAYFANNNLPASKFYNASGRGYPDVAAFATNFEVIIGGGASPVDGTSCAAPTASAIFSLLNDIRFQNGKSSLGFLNPLLYSLNKAGAFNDITQGNNGGGCCPGFNAARGWDPVTGLGSPNYGVLKEVILSLP